MATPATPPLSISGDYLFYMSMASIAGVVIVICTIVVALRHNDRLFNSIVRHESVVLRVMTVLFLVWAATALAIMGRLEGQVSALFGAIVGYVFGSIKGEKGKDD